MKRKFLIFICMFLAIVSIAGVSASDDVTDDVISVSNDIAIDEIASEVDSGDESIAVQNDDDSSSLLAEGELKDPGLNLTVVRNGVMVSFNEENVNGIVIYTGDSQMSEGEFINYNGTPYFIDMNDLPADDYPVAVQYLGNDIFKSAYDFVVVSVEKINPGINATLNGTQLTVTFNDENATMLEVFVHIYLNESERRTFSHFYFNEPLVVDDFSFLAPGQYTVEVGSIGDGIYRGSDIVKFNVTVPERELKDPGLTLTVVRNGVLVSFNENVTGFFRYYGDVKPNEFVNITGEPYLIDMNGLPADYYPVNVEYVGNEVYSNASDSVMVPVLANDPGINVTLSGTQLTVTFNDENATMLEVYVDVWLNESDARTFSHFYFNEPLVVDDFSFLAPGQYAVEVASLPDDIYYSGSEIVELIVTVPEKELKDPGLNLTLVYNGVLVSFNENVTGFFRYYGDVKPNEFVNITGEPYLIDMNGLPADYYPVNVEYVGNEVYSNASDSVMVPVLPNDPEINATLNGTQLTVTFNDKNATMLDVRVRVWLNESEVKTFSHFYFNEPLVVDDFSFLAPGVYPIEVASLPDNIYYRGSEILKFNVTVPGTELKDPGLNLTVVRNGVLVSFNENVTGFFRYYGDVKPNEFINITGEPYLIDMNGLPADYYPVNVEYVGNDEFANASDYVMVLVESNVPEFDVSVNGTEITIILDEKDNANDVFVRIPGDNYSRAYATGWGPIVADLSDLAPGTYPVEIYFFSDDYYIGLSTIVNVTVPSKYMNPGLNVSVDGCVLNITLNASSNSPIGVEVRVPGEEYSRYWGWVGEPIIADLSDLSGLDDCNYTVVVVSHPTGLYEGAVAEVNVTVPSKYMNPGLNVSVDGCVLNITLNASSNSPIGVEVRVPGEEYSRYWGWVGEPIIADLSDLAPGDYNIVVVSHPTDHYEGAVAEVNVTVGEENKTIISKDLTKIEKAPDRFEANFTDAEGNALVNATVSFEINGNVYNRTTDANGTAGMNINLEAGEYTITITNPTTGETKQNTITVLSRFEDANDLVKYFRNESQYVITVLGDDGKIAPNGTVVTFNINGVFYNRTVNESGQVKLTINLNPGDYVITAEYKGCRVSNNITVLPVLTGNNITKKYGEPGAYEATLVDGQGNPFANQTITFNINGVFYNRTTDSNGIAKLNINLMPGEYIITANYGEARISNKVTVTA